MRITIEVEQIVLHDISLAQADRGRLLEAVRQAIAQQVRTRRHDWSPTAVPVLTPAPIAVRATDSGVLATAIAGATVQALGPSGGRS